MIELRGICKRFGMTVALRDASFNLAPGEIHALLGENGAGKTTLVRCLHGMVRPDSGEIRIDGRVVSIRSPREALALGIVLVHQHFMLIPALSVADNLMLGGRGSRRLERDDVRVLLEEYRLHLDPDLPAARLGVAEMQRLEIVRALARGARVLILDEPTAVLAPSEIKVLLGLLARLREEGHAIVFISHKLEEITSVCDRVSVLRHGTTCATRPVAQLDIAELGRLMVGASLPPPGTPPDTVLGALALSIRDLRTDGLHGLDLELRAGEILAVAGIAGNGQDPLERVLAGVQPIDSGEIDLAAAPLVLISGDRVRTGLVADLSVAENLVLEDAAHRGTHPTYRAGGLRRAWCRRHVDELIDRFGIQADAADRAGSLSGGNQQKLCVARALRREPGVLLAVHPTRGLDVAATAVVREALRAQARNGTAVLLVSADLDEVLELGTRVAVLFRGKLYAVDSSAPTREQIGRLMLGERAA